MTKTTKIILALIAVNILLIITWNFSLNPPDFLDYVGAILLAHIVAGAILFYRYFIKQ